MREKIAKVLLVKTLQQILACWNINEESLKLISESINLVYRFEINGQGYYLRITHSKFRRYKALMATLDFLKFLHAHGAPVPEVVPSIQKKLLEEIVQGERIFFAHVVTEVPGEIIHFRFTDNQVYHAWGQSLGLLHQAAKKYPGDQQYFLTWQQVWHGLKNYLEHEDEPIKQQYQIIEDWFNALPVDDSDFGLTHGDHRRNNVLFDGQQIYFIDFDEPVYHWWMADIARAFLSKYQQDRAGWQAKFDAYIAGYREVMPLTDEQLSHLDWFVRMKSMDIYLWVKNNWPDEQQKEDWLLMLRKVILRK